MNKEFLLEKLKELKGILEDAEADSKKYPELDKTVFIFPANRLVSTKMYILSEIAEKGITDYDECCREWDSMSVMIYTEG